MTKQVTCARFFPPTVTAEDACAHIEAQIATLETPEGRGAQVYQRVQVNAVTGYIREARAAPSQAGKWRAIAEAMFWCSAAFSGKPFDNIEQKERRRDTAGNENLVRGNATRRDDANVKAVEVFEQWCAARRAVLAGLAPPEKLRKYLRVARPGDRAGRRLRALLKAGKLK